jgi:t-SNARE complex subunit (syntaxin)
MNEPQHNRDIYDILTELRVDIGVIKTQVGYFSEIKTTAENADSKAEVADAKAERALSSSAENAKDIEGLKKTIMWAISIIVPSILTIVGILATVVF